MSLHSFSILSKYKHLLRLVRRLPLPQQKTALDEARSTIRSRKHETDPEKILSYHKELTARLAFLRTVTPKFPSDAEFEEGYYVVREGKVVEGRGEVRTRVADGTISIEEAKAWNDRHFKRFHGYDRPANMLF